MTSTQFDNLQKGRETQMARARLRRRIHDDALELTEDDWYEIIEARSIEDVRVLDFLRYLPRLGQGHVGGRPLAYRMMQYAGIPGTKRCGQLTLRQAARLVDEIQAWTAKRRGEPVPVDSAVSGSYL